MNTKELIQAMECRGFEVFKDASKPFNLNIVGIRSKDRTPNIFNDEIHVFWIWRGKWSHLCFAATTDPGLYFLNNPLNLNGTIIMYPGQYPGAYKNGHHKGEIALEQVRPMKYWRDGNRDSNLDPVGEIYEENAKTNLHKAGENSIQIDRWSAGCQVLASELDFNLLMYLTHKAERFWGNSFTYTLIEA